MATTHRDTLLGRINNIPVTDTFSPGQRAQLRNAYANETENVCLATLNANPTDQGLIDEAVSRFPTQTAQGAAPAGESRPFFILFIFSLFSLRCLQGLYGALRASQALTITDDDRHARNAEDGHEDAD